MTIFHKIEATHFSPSEEEVIKYILDKKEDIEDESTIEIARNTYTSAPILVRLAKKLGFNGWNDFKKAYLKELLYLNEESEVDASIPFVVTDNYMTIANNIASLEISSIKDTLQLLSHDNLYEAMRYLRDANTIDVFGVSSNMIMANDFAQKMIYDKKRVNVCRTTGSEMLQAATTDSTHCAILISYSGETKYILNAAKALKKRNVKIIGITSIGDNTLSKMADVTLRISSKEMIQTKIGDFSSTQSVKLILDILYSCIFSLDYKNNLEYKIKIAKEVDDRYSGFEYIDE